MNLDKQCLMQSVSFVCDFLYPQPSVRKTHNGGRKHKENVRFYYTKWMEEQAQSLIDQTSMWLILNQFLHIPNSYHQESTFAIKKNVFLAG